MKMRDLNRFFGQGLQTTDSSLGTTITRAWQPGWDKVHRDPQELKNLRMKYRESIKLERTSNSEYHKMTENKLTKIIKRLVGVRL
jgi:hypothetical protein